MALLMRPGYTLLLAGIASYFASKFVDVLPVVGSMMAVMLFLFAMFAVVGGIWLVIAERRNANT
ncbi:MAG: hypothetical protein ACRBK7_05225 [Acidimicrobiales bacterium]